MSMLSFCLRSLLVATVLVSFPACQANQSVATINSAAGAQEVVSADQIIRRVAGFYKGITAATVNVEQTRVFPAGNDTPQNYRLAVRRPNKLAAIDESGTSINIICTGTTSYYVWPSRAEYAQSSLGVLDDLAFAPAPLSVGGWGVMFGPALFCNNPYEALMAGDVLCIEYRGKDQVDGVPTHHIRVEQPQFNWEMWVAAAGDPWLLQLKFDQPPATFKATDQDFKELTVRFRNWVADKQLSPALFQYQPPAEFHPSDDLREIVFGSSRPITPEAP